MRVSLFRIVLIAAGCMGFAGAAAAQQTTYLQLSPTVKAVLYSPAQTGGSRVAVLNMHEDGNRLDDIACTELVKRGIYVLCMNGRSDNNEALDFWNDLPLDIATGMKYLKDTVKATKILQGDEDSSIRRQRRRPAHDVLPERRAKRPGGLPGQREIDPVQKRFGRPAAGRRHHHARRAPRHGRQHAALAQSVDRARRPAGAQESGA